MFYRGVDHNYPMPHRYLLAPLHGTSEREAYRYKQIYSTVQYYALGTTPTPSG